MREILFRGIPKDDTTRHFFSDIWKDNCEGSFVYGSLIVSKDRYYICVSALCKINSCINNGMISMIEVIPETVGQYTGLTDKEGKKIFEGDIVKAEEFISTVNGLYRVIHDEINHCYALERDAEFHHSYFSFSALNGFHNTSCVIGNIHDNPELLGGVSDA